MERRGMMREYIFRYIDRRRRSYEMRIFAENEEEARNEFRTRMYNIRRYTVKEKNGCGTQDT